MTKEKLVKSFMDIGHERKRDNDRKDAIEVENKTLRMLEIEKTQNNQFTFLFEKGNELKRQLLDAAEDVKDLNDK